MVVPTACEGRGDFFSASEIGWLLLKTGGHPFQVAAVYVSILLMSWSYFFLSINFCRYLRVAMR